MMRARRVTAVLAGLALIGATLVVSASSAGAAPGGQANLGPNVYIFSPDMPQSQIQSTVNAIADQQIPNQFGTQRYALLFEPGTYAPPPIR